MFLSLEFGLGNRKGLAMGAEQEIHEADAGPRGHHVPPADGGCGGIGVLLWVSGERRLRERGERGTDMLKRAES